MAEIGNVTVRVDAVITDEQYREAMSAVRAANERMDLLEAENAKLKQELEAVGTAAYLYGRNDLAAENAKLRELVADLFAMCTSDCLECEHGYDNGSCRLYDRMRELGIEDE